MGLGETGVYTFPQFTARSGGWEGLGPGDPAVSPGARPPPRPIPPPTLRSWPVPGFGALRNGSLSPALSSADGVGAP